VVYNNYNFCELLQLNPKYHEQLGGMLGECLEVGSISKMRSGSVRVLLRSQYQYMM